MFPGKQWLFDGHEERNPRSQSDDNAEESRGI